MNGSKFLAYEVDASLSDRVWLDPKICPESVE